MFADERASLGVKVSLQDHQSAEETRAAVLLLADAIDDLHPGSLHDLISQGEFLRADREAIYHEPPDHYHE
jgi:hypothetical protein